MSRAIHTVTPALFAVALAVHTGALAFGERDPGYASPNVKENGFCSGGLVAFDDGSAVVGFAGWERDSQGLARLLPDGSIDTAWGQAGRAMGVGSPLVRTPEGGLLASQATAEGHRFLRLSRDGRIDLAYGTNGLSDALPSVAEAVLQPDGALVARGTTRDGFVAFARLDPHGRLDASFGNAGVLKLPLAGTGGIRIYAWGVDRNGMVQVAYHAFNEPTRPLLRRFPAAFETPDGAPPDGRLVPREVIASWLAPRAKVQPDGALIIGDMCVSPACVLDKAVVARFDANGRSDASFGAGGRVSVDILEPARGLSSSQAPVALLAGEGGRHTMLIRYLRHSGGTFGYNPTGLAAARLMADGSLDPAFPNGIKLGAENSAFHWAQLDDGRLLVQDDRVIVQNGMGVSTCLVARLATDSPRAEAVLVEYRRPAGDHYFITAEGVETHALDNLPIGIGWERTGQTFGAWLDRDLPGATPVCRFYGDTRAGPASHFFIPEGADCDALKSLGERTPLGQLAWRFEGRTFRVREAFGGGCPANLAPVLRLYNNGFARGVDSNHRYVTDAALYAQMQERGWIAEGIAFCVPPASHSAGS